MAKTDFKTIDEYHLGFPPEIRERLETIRNIIKTKVPGADETISYQIPAFKYHGYLIYYSAYKNHISLSAPFSKAFLNAFSAELKRYKTSRAAIQFPNDEKLPVSFIGKIIAFRKKENEEIQKTRSKK
ncbi:MAG TPA: DUF1801 domain-containing protein [Flavitalea sp.]|nr:DUF1801 domain-containing protein [Flavitalea sp.]